MRGNVAHDVDRPAARRIFVCCCAVSRFRVIQHAVCDVNTNELYETKTRRGAQRSMIEDEDGRDRHAHTETNPSI